MSNPPKPVELKRKQGNPGKRALPAPVVLLDAGRVDAPVELGAAGRRLWESVFDKGGLWVSGRTDTHLLLIVCQQLDRRDELMEAWRENPVDRPVNMSLLETEKQIAVGLGLLGFTPTDRARLGLAEVKAKSKLEEMQEAREKRQHG